MALSKFVIEGAGTNFATIGFRDSLMEIVTRIHKVGYTKPVRSEVTLRVRFRDDIKYFTKIRSYLRSKYKLEFNVERRVFRMPPNYTYRFTINDTLFDRYMELESLIIECETSLRLSYDTY